MKCSRSLAAALVLASALSSTACKSGEPWAFTVTRTVNESGISVDLLESTQHCENSTEVALAVILLPFVIDLAFLPVTLTHDAVACK